MADKPTMLGQAARDANGPLSLKERFERFMSFGDFAESIDALTVNSNIPGRRKADYLALRRSVIIEQKSIDRDVDAKVSSFLGELILQHGPLTAGDVTLAGIIDAVAKLPPPNLFKRRPQSARSDGTRCAARGADVAPVSGRRSRRREGL
jgi:hypothetical protein